MSRRAVITTLAAGAIAVGTAAGAVSAPAGAATAPTITLTNPQRCFVNTFTLTPSGTSTERYATVHISGANWHPGAQVQLDFAGITDEVEKTAGSDGTFTASFQLPDPDLGYENSRTYQALPVIAVDFGDGNLTDLGGSIAITKQVYFTDREVNAWEDHDDVYGQTSVFHYSDPVYFKASGFTPGKDVYAHYVFNGTKYTHRGALISTVDLGTASGPCGTVNHQAHIFPFKPSPQDLGDYTLDYSSNRVYSPGTSEYSWLFAL